MGKRVATMVVVAAALATDDLVVKTAMPTQPWNLHQRSLAWFGLSIFLVAAVAALALLPSRPVALFAGMLNGGGLGNLVSAAQHGLLVPNPFVVGRIAFNLADVFVVGGAVGLTVSLAGVSVRYRHHLLPPRRWERALLRRLGA